MSKLAPAIKNIFHKITGAERALSDADMNYLAEKLFGRSYVDYDVAGQVSFQQFAKVRTELKN